MQFDTVQTQLTGHVAILSFNRSDKANALNWQLWQDIRSAMRWADTTPEVRVVILRGEGKHFTAGIDLLLLQELAERVRDDCGARSREKLRATILDVQDCLTAIERCRKPVLAAIHGACVGAGVDLICCTDVRYAATDAHFAVKEVDLGIVADVGTLQRLPKLIGSQSLVRELAFTGRRVAAEEALACGLINAVHETREALDAASLETAQRIAEKSPLALRGIKEMLNYSRDHSVADGLNYVATWNAAMLLSQDLDAAIEASMTHQKPQFRD